MTLLIILTISLYKKVSQLRESMNTSDNHKSKDIITNIIMNDKVCTFEFHQVEVKEVEKLLCALPDNKLAGVEDLDSKLLRITASCISSPVTHIINRCLCVCKIPMFWKTAKIVPIPKDKKIVFNESNSRSISIIPVLSKIIEKVVYMQIHDYFFTNNFITMSQHAFRTSHSTSTALIKMTDDWFRAIDNSLMVGAVLLDLTAAFDLLDHSLLIKNLNVMVLVHWH